MPSPSQTASQVMEVIPLVMRTLRAEMRAHRDRDLTVPQFRSLGYVRRHPGTWLSALADHIGITLPSASKLVEGLVERKLIVRRMHSGDRRRMRLHLTASGSALLEQAHGSALAALANRLSGLTDEQQSQVIQAMVILGPVFANVTERVPSLTATRLPTPRLASLGTSLGKRLVSDG